MKTYSRKKGDSPSNVIIHVNELCRLCLAKEEEMVPIYDDESVPLPLRILGCVNIEVGRRSVLLIFFLLTPPLPRRRSIPRSSDNQPRAARIEK